MLPCSNKQRMVQKQSPENLWGVLQRLRLVVFFMQSVIVSHVSVTQRGLNSEEAPAMYSPFQNNGCCAKVNAVLSQQICNSTYLNGYNSLPLKNRVWVQWQMETKRGDSLWPVITIKPKDTNSLCFYLSFNPLWIKESKGKQSQAPE